MFNFWETFQKDKWTQTINESQENGHNDKRKKIESESGPMEIDPFLDELHPLKMGSIQQVIFGFLDVQSLKAARQVNKPWSVEGAKILLTKCYVKIPSDLHDAESSTKDETMTKFKTFLAHKSSDISMIPKITVKAVVDVELWKSLGVLGPQVKSLKLTTMDEKKKLLKNLLDLLPNLKYLKLQIKRSWYHDTDIIKILRISMSKPEKNGSLLVISDIMLYYKNLEDFEELERFSDCSNIKFEILRLQSYHKLSRTVHNFFDRMAVVASKLLLTSHSALYSLHLCCSENWLKLIQFPSLAKLQSLFLLYHSQTYGALPPLRFPPGFRFTEKVPNLIQFYIDCEKTSSGPEIFANFFENTGTAPSVKQLTCVESSTEFPMDVLFQTFPETTRFLLTSSQFRSRTFEGVCKYSQNIELLEIVIDLDLPIEQVANLDALLTGIAPEVVEKIKKVPEGADETLENVEELRVNPSILDLKELKALEIHFKGSRLDLLPERTLAIAGQYAFKLMPADFKIFICVPANPEPDIRHYRTIFAEVSKLPNVRARLAKMK